MYFFIKVTYKNDEWSWAEGGQTVAGGSSTSHSSIGDIHWGSIRQGYCVSDLYFVSIIDQVDEKSVQLVLTNPNHVLFSLFPDKTEQHSLTLDKGATRDSLSLKVTGF